MFSKTSCVNFRIPITQHLLHLRRCLALPHHAVCSMMLQHLSQYWLILLFVPFSSDLLHVLSSCYFLYYYSHYFRWEGGIHGKSGGNDNDFDRNDKWYWCISLLDLLNVTWSRHSCFRFFTMFYFTRATSSFPESNLILTSVIRFEVTRNLWSLAIYRFSSLENNIAIGYGNLFMTRTWKL